MTPTATPTTTPDTGDDGGTVPTPPPTGGGGTPIVGEGPDEAATGELPAVPAGRGVPAVPAAPAIPVIGVTDQAATGDDDNDGVAVGEAAAPPAALPCTGAATQTGALAGLALLVAGGFATLAGRRPRYVPRHAL